jgi:hypothetical protein
VDENRDRDKEDKVQPKGKGKEEGREVTLAWQLATAV